MKRSELLSKMIKCYLTCTEKLKYTPDKAMDRVLEICEENGMIKCEKRDLGSMGKLWTPEGWEPEEEEVE